MANLHLLQSAKELSPESLDVWGDKIGSRKLSREIASLDRFSDRVMNRVFASATVAGPNETANGGVSALDLVPDYSQVQLSAEDVEVGTALRNDAATLVRICGIVVYGEVYRKNVTRKEFGDLQRNFSQRELRIGCQLREEHRRFFDAQVDMKRLAEMTSIAGNHCLAVWFQAMPASFRRELEMVGAHADAYPAYQEIGLAADHCIRIVRAVGHQLNIQ